MKYSVNMISIDNITSPVILLIDGIEHERTGDREKKGTERGNV